MDVVPNNTQVALLVHQLCKVQMKRHTVLYYRIIPLEVPFYYHCLLQPPSHILRLIIMPQFSTSCAKTFDDRGVRALRGYFGPL